MPFIGNKIEGGGEGFFGIEETQPKARQSVSCKVEAAH